jgi:hypothetical protein
MRSILAGLTMAAALGLAALPTSASPFNIAGVETLGTGVEHIQYERSRYCERLRRACAFKEERGETGEGNCRRYRRECR